MSDAAATQRATNLDKTIKAAIQQAINDAIAELGYHPPLPSLDNDIWSKAFDWNAYRARNDRLEWLGDSLLYSTISVELYHQIPEGNPGMYTAIRVPLVTNQTFALLSNKLDISGSLVRGSQVHVRPPTEKYYADLFEVLPAELYTHNAFERLREWVAEVFKPLISAAVIAYQAYVFASVYPRPKPIDPFTVSHRARNGKDYQNKETY